MTWHLRQMMEAQRLVLFSERIRRCSSNSDRSYRCVFPWSAIPLIDTRGSIAFVTVIVSVDINLPNCLEIIINDCPVVPTYFLGLSLEIVVTLGPSSFNCSSSSVAITRLRSQTWLVDQLLSQCIACPFGNISRRAISNRWYAVSSTNMKRRKSSLFIPFPVSDVQHWATPLQLFSLVALMCRLIQLLILFYGIAYLMIHKKGYQETDTSIISSITLKVKVNALVRYCCFISSIPPR